jgi:putative membrane protein
MLKDHEKDVAEFQKEAANGKASAVKNAASQGETVISEHLKMVQKMAQDHGVTGGKTSSGADSH